MAYGLQHSVQSLLAFTRLVTNNLCTERQSIVSSTRRRQLLEINGS
jgi:hypothetical protein